MLSKLNHSASQFIDLPLRIAPKRLIFLAVLAPLFRHHRRDVLDALEPFFDRHTFTLARPRSVL